MQLHHIGLEVLDLEKASAFYKRKLDFAEEQTLNALGEKIVFLKNDDLRLELIESNEKGNKLHICFQVKDLLEASKTLTAQGLTIIEGPYKLENGWETVFFQGPIGEILEFLKISHINEQML